MFLILLFKSLFIPFSLLITMFVIFFFFSDWFTYFFPLSQSDGYDFFYLMPRAQLCFPTKTHNFSTRCAISLSFPLLLPSALCPPPPHVPLLGCFCLPAILPQPPLSLDEVVCYLIEFPLSVYPRGFRVVRAYVVYTPVTVSH